MKDINMTALRKFLEVKAILGQPTVYGEIFEVFELGSTYNPNMRGKLGQALGTILADCVHNGLPPLTSIVVRKSGKDKGLPGEGFWALAHMLDPSATLDSLNAGTPSEIRIRKRALIEQWHRETFEYYAAA